MTKLKKVETTARTDIDGLVADESMLSKSSQDQRSHNKVWVARQNPTIVLVPLVLFAALCTAGLVLVFFAVSSNEDEARLEAEELAESTGTWFSNQLEQAILPLFSLAQFAVELDMFRDLPERIGPKGAPDSLPFLPSSKPVPTHRNVTGVCTDPVLVERFAKIAATIKDNAGMQGVLVNLQFAPLAVVCLVHPLNNTEDFSNGIYMDNSGAIGHDLLNDPARKFIAEATIPADSLVIAGPLSLKQCAQCDPAVEKGFIARLPIKSHNHSIEVDGVAYNNRWGFAVAIINWNNLVERSNLYQSFSSRNLGFQLTRTDRIIEDDVEAEEVVVLAETPGWDPTAWRTVTVALETTNNEWEMTVGYQVSRSHSPLTLSVAVVLLSGLFSALIYIVMAQKQVHVNFREEQAALLVKSAQDAMNTERDLNDYIAHEVRNPLSAAIAASSFVNASVKQLLRISPEDNVLKDNTQCGILHTVHEDMAIIDQSLHFINELLRSMLDMHRAVSRQIQLQNATLSVLDDILLPVKGMLYGRDNAYTIQVDCPEDLTIVADRLRLQQIMLNLARNSTKFVTSGYVRLGASVLSKSRVRFFVEDSGCGIPTAKRVNLFQRYQESLDTLNQGTGVGLYLCKKLVDLMGGKLELDENFDSGVAGFPGTRIVVELGTGEVSHAVNTDDSPEQVKISSQQLTLATRSSVSNISPSEAEDDGEVEWSVSLPENLNVLVVDDDRTLRKLARRSLSKVAPTWTICEASSGEHALSMATSIEDPKTFHIIFIDQYMATVGQALKGTETVRQLRAHGIKSALICGLSANSSSEEPFLNCGADAFWLKPIPCRFEDLRQALIELIALHDGNTCDNV